MVPNPQYASVLPRRVKKYAGQDLATETQR